MEEKPMVYKSCRNLVSCLNVLLAGAAIMGMAAAAEVEIPQMRGGRFKPLAAAEMQPDQKALAETIVTGPRKSIEGPFNIMLRSPELGDLLQKTGLYLRFNSPLSPKVKE